MQTAEERFDCIIVDRGSAGCVLANRLAADPAVRVAPVEAGADTPPRAVPKELLDFIRCRSLARAQRCRHEQNAEDR